MRCRIIETRIPQRCPRLLNTTPQHNPSVYLRLAHFCPRFIGVYQVLMLNHISRRARSVFWLTIKSVRRTPRERLTVSALSHIYIYPNAS